MNPNLLILTIAFALAAAMLGSGSGSPALSQPGLEYTIRLHEPQTQMIEIRIAAPDLPPGAEHVDFVLPAWRPGKYAILDAAGTVRDVAATSAAAEPLPVRKLDKQTWRVATQGQRSVALEYRVFANSLADRTRHADDTHAFISPSSVLMYVPERRALPVRVRIEAPEEWAVATGLEPEGGDPRVRVAPDYDVLVDSPIEIGRQYIQTFTVDGVPHEIVVWSPTTDPAAARPAPKRGEKPTWDRMPEDFAKIVETQREIFGGLPYARYVYLIHAYPGGGGGTEHLNSTVMGANPRIFEDENAYKRFLGLVSHEMFHTWNVKQFRPAGLKPYDYTRENYTELLWVAEGTTSYYDDLTLARAGLMETRDYLKRLGDSIDTLRKRPGAAVQSLEESSFDAWIKFNRPHADSINSTVSFYDKGALVSLLLDLELRRRTGNRVSLDDAMRTLCERFPLDGPGYTTEDLLATLGELDGSGFDDFFGKYVRGVEPLDFETALPVLGLELVRDGKKNNDGEDAQGAGDAPEQQASIGLTLENRDGLAAVTAVLADGPARAAGINAGDLVVALNGRRLRAGDLNGALERLAPGDTVTLTYLRYDELRTARFPAGASPRGKWTIRRIEDPTPEQKAAFESWIGHTWDGKKPTPEDETPPAGASR